MRRKKLLLIVTVVVVLVLGTSAFRWQRGRIPVGSEVRIELCTGQGCGGWRDLDRGDLWCIEPFDQRFPAATGSWDDGVLHGGKVATGTLHFDSEARATFRGDLDGDAHPEMLERRSGRKIGC